MTNEQWKPIDLPTPYPMEVSNFGRVRWTRVKIQSQIFENLIKEVAYTQKGHPAFTVQINKKPKLLRICRLVANAFLDNPDNKRCVIHLDKNIKNNHFENLKWGNARPRKTPSKKRILTVSNARDIRTRCAKGESTSKLAKEYKVSVSLISHIKAGRKYREA